MKTQIFEKKGQLSNEKNFVAYFFSYYRTWKYRWTTFYKSLQGISKIFAQKISSFLLDLRGR